MEEYLTQLRDALEEVASVLQESSNAEDLDLCAVRLETYAENALLQNNISLQIVDILNKAANILKNKVDAERRFPPYEAPVEQRGTRGRPKFVITEQQLTFLKVNNYYIL